MSLEIVIDSKCPYRLAHFWAAALPGYEVRPYDEDEIARLAALGLTRETDTSVPIDSIDKPTVWFQKSDDLTTSRNRIHFDLKFGNRHAEVTRLLALGATVLKERVDHIVMLDPEGNQFCLFDP
ncbi:MAG: VOC family protein [Pseudomonadales bacterium]|nr:VOC family protein [Pseudomonadales bacterium]